MGWEDTVKCFEMLSSAVKNKEVSEDNLNKNELSFSKRLLKLWYRICNNFKSL